MRRIKPYFPLSHGIPRVDDRRIISGIVFVIRNGLRWRDAPKEYGPHKTIYNRFIRWSRLGVFSRILAELAGRRGNFLATSINTGIEKSAEASIIGTFFRDNLRVTQGCLIGIKVPFGLD
jgi:transposase